MKNKGFLLVVAWLCALAGPQRGRAQDTPEKKPLPARPCPCAPKYDGTWEAAVKELLARGRCYDNPYHGKRYGELARYPPGSGVVSLEYRSDRSTDFFDHGFQVMCRKGANGAIEPLGILVSMDNIIAGFGQESYEFRLSSAGVLESGFMIRGPDTAAPGTGTVIPLDLDDPKTRERFQHVEDMWLRGAYRKAAPAKPPADLKRP